MEYEPTVFIGNECKVPAEVDAVRPPHPEDPTFGVFLVGKLLCRAAFDSNAFMSSMAEQWKPQHRMEIRELWRNLFTFRFFDELDKYDVLHSGPWKFNGYILVLEDLPANRAPAEVRLVKVPFWVQVHGLPHHIRTEATARLIGNSFAGVGKFIDWDHSNSYGDFVLRIRVWVDITVPLTTRLLLEVEGEIIPVPTEVVFKYEQLTNFCYHCGLLDHVVEDCDQLPYGPWIAHMETRYGKGPAFVYNGAGSSHASDSFHGDGENAGSEADTLGEPEAGAVLQPAVVEKPGAFFYSPGTS